MSANQAQSVNGVAVPAGMDIEHFTALVTARQGVAGDLSNAFLAENLATQSDAYFESLGAYFVREFIDQMPAGTPVGDRVRFYAESHPVERVTVEQDAAAAQAAAGANVAVVPLPKPVIVDAGAAPIGHPDDAVAVTVQHRGSFLQIIGDDFHEVVMKVARWIDSL